MGAVDAVLLNDPAYIYFLSRAAEILARHKGTLARIYPSRILEEYFDGNRGRVIKYSTVIFASPPLFIRDLLGREWVYLTRKKTAARSALFYSRLETP